VGISMEERDKAQQGESSTTSSDSNIRLFGRIDAEDEDSLPRLIPVADDGLRYDGSDFCKMVDLPSNDYYPPPSLLASVPGQFMGSWAQAPLYCKLRDRRM
jgi:hypothetical protein